MLKQLASDGVIRVDGPNWTTRPLNQLRVDDFKAKILCERHNRALAGLDAHAGEFFRVVSLFDRQLRDPSDATSQFSIFDGEAIERWMIKMLLGMTAAATTQTHDGTRVAELAPGIDTAALMESLFYGAAIPSHQCLYVGSLDRGLPVRRSGDFAHETYLDEAGRMVGYSVEFQTLSLRMLLAPSYFRGRQSKIRVRPAGASFQSGQHAKVIAFGWSERYSEPVTLHVTFAAEIDRAWITPSD